MDTTITYQITFNQNSLDMERFMLTLGDDMVPLCTRIKDILITPINEFFTAKIKEAGIEAWKVRHLVPEDMYTTAEGFKAFVDQMELNRIYALPNFRYTNISLDTDGTDGTYSWSMESNYRISGSVGYVFPMASGNMTKSFKTIKGTKANLIKRNEWIWKVNNY